jgi:glycosyltransferase involved in cell wall biosynthesis
MRLALLSLAYPPHSTEGIARQRHALASSLARQGHTVYVVTLGADTRLQNSEGVRLREVTTPGILAYSQKYPALDPDLTQSQALYEGLAELLSEHSIDLIDLPLWKAQGFVTLQHSHLPVVVWLQTTRAQLMQLSDRALEAAQQAALALDRMCLERAHGWLADSHSVLDAVRAGYGLEPTQPAGVAHLGLPPVCQSIPVRASRDACEALVVGRLERRKGTPLLIEALPGLLRRYPNLCVRFAGADNSREDGWFQRHGQTYPEYFQRRYPEHQSRVAFEGYVEDARLDAYYRQADLLLAPSLYESFGLIYLEAMRVGLPVVTLARGAAREIFPSGETDGACLVSEPAALADAIGQVVESEALRRALGEAAFHRFQAAFTADHMARATLAFYERVLADRRTAVMPRASVVYQVMEALDVGDAVSDITLRNASILADLGQPPAILARYSAPAMARQTQPLHRALAQPECGLIFHYWNYNSSAWLVRAVHGPKAIWYHNITPPQYFPEGSVGHASTARGYAQLAQLADQFDLLLGDSRYNIRGLAPHLRSPKPGLPIYPVVEPAELQTAPYDLGLVNTLRGSGQVNIIFIGRVVRNKRPDRLMHLFEHYFRWINRHAHLWLVGSEQADPEYRTELETLRGVLRCGAHITFTGKVSEAQMRAYFRAADVFVCASEHEGFCVPIAQAMAFDVPVLAYAAAAVPETMGDAGVLVHEWDVPRVAELMHLMICDPQLRQRLLAGQRANLVRFSAAEARMRLTTAVAYLTTGRLSPRFEHVGPVLK